MSKTLEELRTELDAKIPRDCVQSRSNGGFNLSYLAGHYVIDRLNKVLGQGNWEYTTEEMRLVHAGEGLDRYNKPVFSVHYIAKVNLRASIGGTIVTFSDYGYGDGSDKQSQGKAHELAVKEAVTDAIKRNAKNLGMSMGLALYDKTQENVEDGTERRADGAATQNNSRDNSTGSTGSSSGSGATAERAQVANMATGPAAAGPNAEAPAGASRYRPLIKSAAQVLNAKKTLSIAEFKNTYLKPAGAAKVDDLTDEQTLAVYNTLKTTYKELSLN